MKRKEKTVKILLVDDEPDVEILFLQKFRKELKSGKLAIHFANSGEGALSFLDGQDATDLVLILSDINMPGMNGLDLLAIIKSKYVHIKVFMITTNGDSDTYHRAIEIGSDAFLTKPVDFNLVKEKISSLQSGAAGFTM
jgi:CheY-like chemotaxis protein